MLPCKDVQQSQPLFSIEQSKDDPRTPVRQEGFKRPSGSSYTSSTNTCPSSPPELYHIPNKVQDLPPPRPPPDLSNREQPEISIAPATGSGRSSLASFLPPLPRPTPVRTLRASSRAQTSNGYIFRAMPAAESTHRVFRQINDENPNSKQAIPAYINGISRDEPNFPPENNSKEDRLPLQPPFRQERDIRSHPPHSGSQTNVISTRDHALVGSKRGKRINDNEDRNEHMQRKRQHIHSCEEQTREEEDFAQMEEFIINAIHDDSFVRLVERIGGIWQRMGFEKAVPKLFTEEKV